ncbi:competence-damage inducible protein, fragment [Alteracholeplasma palmae J233]|uniref:Competence-damage inducible protein n=1 Tax=Alteracholeplasma palmae (strain ATCC 49389 / J233) TaxID=1318466 RepID=U4KQM4_ALTPJ|nr:nicotinamide-nucleotide amidohydrolase family protein [Alteracholeplasma palmae]CCV64835.1 competence-damage inducible protein, fragment [Alteracholeplasma palmae J233]
MNHTLTVLQILIDKKLTIAFAESMTGGLLTGELVKIPNASLVLKESLVVYSVEAKNKYLHIDFDENKPYKIVSNEVSEQMASGLMELTHADICVSITGNAGPGYDKGTDELEGYITIKDQKRFKTYQVKFNQNSTRIENINQAIIFTYEKLEEYLKNK